MIHRGGRGSVSYQYAPERSSGAAPRGAGMGRMLSILPDGCSQTCSEGQTYYNCEGVHYQPYHDGDSVVYFRA